jgi:hypothetical protein
MTSNQNDVIGTFNSTVRTRDEPPALIVRKLNLPAGPISGLIACTNGHIA